MAPENLQVIHLKLQTSTSKGQSSSRDRQKSQNLPITPRRVRQLLHESPNLVYRDPALTAKHKKMHVHWIKKKVTWTMEKWETVVFFDEKRFNLDGPDGSQCYWHDLRKKQLFSKRPFRGGSVMVWRAFTASWNADLVVMEGKQNSARYINVFEKNLPIYESSRHQ